MDDAEPCDHHYAKFGEPVSISLPTLVFRSKFHRYEEENCEDYAPYNEFSGPEVLSEGPFS